MIDIRIKEKVYNRSLRTLDKAVRAPRPAKNGARKVQEASGSANEREDNPTQYAAGELEDRTKAAAVFALRETHMGAKRAYRQGRTLIQERQEKNTKESRWRSAEESAQSAGQPQNNPVRQCVDTYGNQSLPPPDHPTTWDTKTHGAVSRSFFHGAESEPAIRPKRHINRSVKPINRTIATARRNVKAGSCSVKTAQQTARASARSAKTAKKAAVMAKQAAVRAARAAQTAAKTTVKVTKAAIKAIIAALKALAAAISAGGWAVALVLLVVALVMGILFSPVGIFYSGESEESRPITEIMAEIENEIMDRVERLKAQTGAAEAVIDHEGDQIVENWRDVIAVFAVKTAGAPQNGADVLILDDDRIERLKQVFWDMNKLTWHVENRKANDDEDDETTVTTLVVEIDGKSASEMAAEYGFSKQQIEALELLLSNEFRAMFRTLLGIDGEFTSSGELMELENDLPVGEIGAAVVKLALSRLGDPYSQKLRGQGRYTDCSYLSLWCYRQVGLRLPATAAAQAKFCVDNGLTISRTDLAPGDLVFFSHRANGRFMNITHVAIYAKNGMIVDASSSRGEVVYRKLISGHVLYARPYAKLSQ